MTIKQIRMPLHEWLITRFVLGLLVIIAACQPNPEPMQVSKDNDVTPLPTPVVASKPLYTVQRGTVVNEIDFTGRVTPEKEAMLSFRSNGYVHKIYVNRGDQVENGQLLVELDSGDLDNQISQAQLALQTSQTQIQAEQQVISDTLAEAQIRLNIEELKLEQAKYLQSINGGRLQDFAVQIQEQQVKLAQQAVDKLQRGIDPRLKLSVDSAQLALERLQAQKADTQLIAPFDGIVTLITVYNSGQAVQAYESVIAVGDVSQLEVSADLSSNSAAADLNTGMVVRISPHDRPGEVITNGVVRLVPTRVQGDTDRLTHISLDVAPDQVGLRLGDLVRINAVLAQKEDVLWLPPQAIRTFEGRQFVVVQDENGLHRVDIKLGLIGPERVEILDGVVAGQTVQAP